MVLKKFFYPLLLLLLACQPSGNKLEGFLLPTAEIRYQERSRELRAIMQLRQGDSLATSTTYAAEEGSVSFLGSPMMEQLSTASGERWKTSRNMAWPAELHFELPFPGHKVGTNAPKSALKWQLPVLTVSPPSLIGMKVFVSNLVTSHWQPMRACYSSLKPATGIQA